MVDATSSPRVLLLGADGMLGQAWHRLLQGEGLAHDTRLFPDFDLTKPEHVEGLPLGEFDVVVNCTGWTNVDGAETDEAGATALNGEAQAPGGPGVGAE